MINVTKPFLPPVDEYKAYIDRIWDKNWLTNNGPFVNELELRLKEYLSVDHLLFLSNGTIALQIAIKALDLRGEILTTPFSYVATTSSIVWEGCQPVFVDIDPRSFNINPKLIESAITENTTAILATHVYGNPCDVEAIERIATKHNLKVIYDAAHCFGTKFRGKSIFEFGDISTTSFHATKLFHTTEGGAVITKSADILKKLAHLRNFGHNGPEDFSGVGINGKNSEFHAAMGLCNLKYVDEILKSRREQSLYYNKILHALDVNKIMVNEQVEFNHAYYPILFKSEENLLKAVKLLNENWIFPRRYFYPSLNSLNYVENVEMEISDGYSRRMLCLPLFFGLLTEDMDMISRILLRSQNN